MGRNVVKGIDVNKSGGKVETSFPGCVQYCVMEKSETGRDDRTIDTHPPPLPPHTHSGLKEEKSETGRDDTTIDTPHSGQKEETKIIFIKLQFLTS